MSGLRPAERMRTALVLEDAVGLLLEHTSAAEGFCAVPLLDALGRVICEDCFARTDQPPFDRSPLDGYAARHEDLAEAGADTPAVLTVTQKIYAGDSPERPLLPGETALVATGAPLPSGADCVVAQENTDRGQERVKIYISLKKHQNCVFRGEDLRAGSLTVKKGMRLGSAHIGVLAGQGVRELNVRPRPKIALFSAGSELAGGSFKRGEALLPPLLPGMIYDSNSWMLAARIMELGGEAYVAEHTEDEPGRIADALGGLLQSHDFVVTAGGVSVGARDYMPEAAERLGAETLFHGLGYKPGGLAMAMFKDGKLILCLSGNPFAAFMSFELLGRPVLEKLSGLSEPKAIRAKAVLRGRFPKASPHRRFLRGYLAGEEVFLANEGHASGSLSSLTRCNCLIDIPSSSPPLSDGAVVDVVLL